MNHWLNNLSKIVSSFILSKVRDSFPFCINFPFKFWILKFKIIKSIFFFSDYINSFGLYLETSKHTSSTSHITWLSYSHYSTVIYFCVLAPKKIFYAAVQEKNNRIIIKILNCYLELQKESKILRWISVSITKKVKLWCSFFENDLTNS